MTTDEQIDELLTALDREAHGGEYGWDYGLPLDWIGKQNLRAVVRRWLSLRGERRRMGALPAACAWGNHYENDGIREFDFCPDCGAWLGLHSTPGDVGDYYKGDAAARQLDSNLPVERMSAEAFDDVLKWVEESMEGQDGND